MSSFVRKLSQFTQKEVDALFANARRVFRSVACTVLVAPQQREFGRILIMVPRQVGNAPTRNKIRRQIKALFYEEKLFTKGLDMVFLFRKGAAQMTFAQFKDILTAIA